MHGPSLQASQDGKQGMILELPGGHTMLSALTPFIFGASQAQLAGTASQAGVQAEQAWGALMQVQAGQAVHKPQAREPVQADLAAGCAGCAGQRLMERRNSGTPGHTQHDAGHV